MGAPIMADREERREIDLNELKVINGGNTGEDKAGLEEGTMKCPNCGLCFTNFIVFKRHFDQCPPGE